MSIVGIPFESLPIDEGTPVEEFTDDQGRLVRVIIVRTVVTRTTTKDGEKTVTTEPKEIVIYLIGGKPVKPESIMVNGQPIEPKKPQDIVPSLTEFITPLEEIPVETVSLDENVPFDQSVPVEEFTDDQGRVVRVVIVRTIVTRTVIRNGVKTVTREPKQDAVYVIDGRPIEPENIMVDGKPIEHKAPEEYTIPVEHIPVEFVVGEEQEPSKPAIDELRELSKVLDENVIDIPVTIEPVEGAPSVTTVQFEERFLQEVRNHILFIFIYFEKSFFQIRHL